MSLQQQRLHIVELKEAKKLKESEKKIIEAISRLALIVGGTFVMLALVFVRR